MRKNKLHKITAVLAVIAVLACLIGTLAYFTDRVEGNASVTTANLKVTPTPNPDAEPDDPTKPDPEDYEDPTPNDPTDDLTNWWAYLNSRAMVNFNPGDKMDLSFILVNSGEMAVDVRETFIITTSEPLSSNLEFALFMTYETDAAGANFGVVHAGTPIKIDDTHYMYQPPQFTLSSTTDAVGSASTQMKCNYYLIFNALSGNDFQGATCTVEYVIEAKQHSEGGEADWVTAATATLTVGDQELSVVPAA